MYIVSFIVSKWNLNEQCTLIGVGNYSRFDGAKSLAAVGMKDILRINSPVRIIDFYRLAQLTLILIWSCSCNASLRLSRASAQSGGKETRTQQLLEFWV